jgi:hypothetical protein
VSALLILLGLAAFVLWFVLFSPNLCPSCGLELGVSLSEPWRPADQCLSCGWRRR